MVVDELFHALADPTRRDILRVVLDHDESVSALGRRYPMSLPAVQKHVLVLERAGLVTKERRGREQRVSGVPSALAEAHRAIDELEAAWRGRFERIHDLLTADPNGS